MDNRFVDQFDHGRCPATVQSMHDPDVDGTCMWCRKRVAEPMVYPREPGVSQLALAYAYFFESDY